VPTLEIAASRFEVPRGETVTITPTWKTIDGVDRPPLKIEYLVDSKVISTSATLDPFVWDTSTEPKTPNEYGIEAKGYDSILRDAPPAISNQIKVKMSIPAPEAVAQSVEQNWLPLLLLPLVIVLLILVVPNRKKIAQTARTQTTRLQRTATRLLSASPAGRYDYKLIGLGGQEFPLRERIVRIGRDPDATIALMDLSVSGAHAELTQDQAGGYMIADLTSANGTFVNSRQLQAGPMKGQPGPTVPLRPGDNIRLGAVELQYQYAKVTRRLPGA